MSLYYLYPTDIPTIESGWSGGSRPPVVNTQINDQYGQWYDDLTLGVIHWKEDTAGALPSASGYKVLVTFEQLPPIFSVANVRIFYRFERDSSSYNGNDFKPALWIGGAAYLPSGVAGFAHAEYGFYNLAYDFALNPATGLAWTRADINVAGLGAFFARNTDVTQTSGVFLSAMTLIVDAIGAPMQRDSAIAVASRAQRRYAAPVRKVSVRVPYDVGLNIGPGDSLPISHFAGPHGSEDGWGQNFWQYLSGLVESVEISPDGYVDVSCLDQRQLWALYYDSGWPKSISPLVGDGIIRITKGATRTYQRASLAYAQDPTSLQYVALSNDQENYERRGELFEGAANNLIQYSAFQAGSFTGWTSAGTGDHGSSIAPEAPGAPTSGSPAVMWDPDTTGVSQCALFIAGTAGWATDLTLQATTTPSITANKRVPVSVWFSNPIAGQSPQIWLQRGVDNKWYNFSTKSWQVGKLSATLPTGSAGQVQRYDALVDVGTGATTLKLFVGLDAAVAVPEQASRFHCAQISDTREAFTSPIITTNATGTRSASQLSLTNNTGARVIDMTSSWTVAFEAIPMFTSADVSTGDRFFFKVITNGSANNFASIGWIFSTGMLRIRLNVGGVNTDTTYAISWTYGTAKKIVVRQTQLGEFGETANTVSVFVDGVLVASGVAAPPTFSGAMTAVWGSDTTLGSNESDCVMRKMTVLQYAADDIECARFP